MSAHATPATPQDDPGPPAAGTPYYRGVLHGLIDRGADLARILHEQAIAQAAQQAAAPGQQAPAPAQQAAAPAPQATDAQPTPAPVTTPAPAPHTLIRIAGAFDQIARAVRRCIAQAQSLDAPKQQPAKPQSQHLAPDRTAVRKRIIRAIEDNIQRPSDNPECDGPEILLPEFRERMDGPDLDADISSRPVEDIIKEICRDLGLAALPGTHPWKRRTPADIAELNTRAAAPSSPARNAYRPPGAGPQDGNPAEPQPSPDPVDGHEPGYLSATPRPQPGPVHPASGLPQDPAELVAFVLHHHARTDVRWRPPPED